ETYYVDSNSGIFDVVNEAFYKSEHLINPDSDTESSVQQWAKSVLTSEDVIMSILNNPDLQNIADEQKIVLPNIEYNFSNGRHIVLDYETSRKNLKKYLLLNNKHAIETNIHINPDLINSDNNSMYINTDPSWYGILVVQHDSLKDFVGPNANNTISIKYINDHIDEIYPRGYFCTSKSAIATDIDAINRAVRNTVGMADSGEKDSNDYYVAGDVNLGWIMYAEIALDVVITIATVGGGTLLNGALKQFRALKAAKALYKTNKFFRKFVKKFNALQRFMKKEKELKVLQTHAKEYNKLKRSVDSMRKEGKSTAKLEQEMSELVTRVSRETVTGRIADIEKDIASVEKNIKNIKSKKMPAGQRKQLLEKNNNRLKELKKELYLHKKNPDKYVQKVSVKNRSNFEHPENIDKKLDQVRIQIARTELKMKEFKAAGAFEKEWETLRGLEYLGKKAQTGNTFARTLKSLLKSSFVKTSDVDRLAKTARASMGTNSAKIRDLLFHTTLKAGGAVARFERDAGLLYIITTFLGDMWDKTSDSTNEYTNGIDFKPLCLLSADDIKTNGQDNVVNYGMWLMWEGNSSDPADDDAAFLQATDFAGKFQYALQQIQEKQTVPDCNVDIYVVRPFIRLDVNEETENNDFTEDDLDNMEITDDYIDDLTDDEIEDLETDDENVSSDEENQESSNTTQSGELFYLIMNEYPWSTSEQFQQQVADIAKWEQTQQELTNTDPHRKKDYSVTQTE
ncbi:MAG: hypothetical protein MJ156_02980, partial [Alphaproteobacteria bacterium]|nr:hypothetical protein [Alphaproteobacteria bacterium]